MKNYVIILCWLFMLPVFLQGLQKDIELQMDGTPPPYLYKIISLSNWQASQMDHVVMLTADDAAFIHLATAEQLDRIIQKYWAGAPQYVILKLSTAKLKGKLIYEVNPGGENKYYHLYQGFIPLEAVEEAKTVFKQPLSLPQEETPLPLTLLGDPVLRSPTRPLSRQEILSPEIQDLIKRMKVTMHANNGVGLAAPQVGQPLQLIVMEHMNFSNVTPEQMAERGITPVPFHAMINPSIELLEGDTAEFFESCLSIPHYMGLVKRATAVKVNYLDDTATPQTIVAKGWYARILQHEIDHLNATLYIDRIDLPSLMTREFYIANWKNKSINEIKQLLQNLQINVTG